MEEKIEEKNQSGTVTDTNNVIKKILARILWPLICLILLATMGCTINEEQKILDTAKKFHTFVKKEHYEKAYGMWAKNVEPKYKKKYDLGIFKDNYKEFKKYFSEMEGDFKLKKKTQN